MRILLAGGAGAIGRRLTPQLVAAGHEVWATSRSAQKASVIEDGGGHPLVMDVYEPATVEQAMLEARPDAVIHQLTDLASYDRAANARVRIEGTRVLVDAARRHGVDRMVAQSIAWVVPDGDDLATEEEPYRSDVTPGVPELEHDVLSLAAGVVLRYGQLYGPGTWRAAGSSDAVAAREGRLGSMAEIGDFVHVADAAHAAVLALDWPHGVVNVVDDDPARAEEWMPVFAAAVGAPPPRIPSGLPHGRPVANTLARTLGWSPRFASWRDGFTSPDGGVAS